MTGRTGRTSRGVDALLGVGYLAIGVVIVLIAVLVYDKAFTTRDQVTLDARSVGNALQKGSDVELHGVPVGEVTAVHPVPGGAELTLELDPGVTHRLPEDTVARLLPKTLFGERYVALIPRSGSSARLQPGDAIQQDRSQQAIALQQVFDKMLPVLRTLQPAKVAATLGELSIMLQGRGRKLGDAMVEWAAYVKKLNPHLPEMTDDLARFADVARDYDAAAPDLLSALDAMTTTSHTVATMNKQLQHVFANVITSADTTRGWMDSNQQTIHILTQQSRTALDAIRPYAGEFPCLLQAAHAFIPVMDHTLGKGTDEPGMHVRLQVVPSRGKYLAGVDQPTYESGQPPRCPYVTGQTGTQPISDINGSDEQQTQGDQSQPATIPPPPSRLLRQKLTGAAGLGPANSPGENELIAELVAPTLGMAPSKFPDWGSLLVGPVLRGKEVSLR